MRVCDFFQPDRGSFHADFSGWMRSRIYANTEARYQLPASSLPRIFLDRKKTIWLEKIHTICFYFQTSTFLLLNSYTVNKKSSEKLFLCLNGIIIKMRHQTVLKWVTFVSQFVNLIWLTPLRRFVYSVLYRWTSSTKSCCKMPCKLKKALTWIQFGVTALLKAQSKDQHFYTISCFSRPNFKSCIFLLKQPRASIALSGS